jgi:hypothetical protein
MSSSSNLQQLLKNLDPVLNPGTWVFVSLPDDKLPDPARIVASIREAEGLSVVIDEASATQLGLVPLSTCAWITLSVHSDLQAVGLTAAFSSALAHAGISCNVIAGAMHDHIFVPVSRAGAALDTLRALQRHASETAS